MLEALGKVGSFLLEHADLIEEIVSALAAGAPKEAIRKSIRAAKVAASDQAMRDELGVDF